MSIFVVAPTIPIVRTKRSVRSFCAAKTCSTQERTFNLALLARRLASIE